MFVVHRVRSGKAPELLKDGGYYNPVSVGDYSKALKNAGLEPPYILLPHSISGAYATFRVSNYPEEIEAVVFIDGSQLSADAFEENKDHPGDFQYALKLGTAAGGATAFSIGLAKRDEILKLLSTCI